MALQSLLGFTCLKPLVTEKCQVAPSFFANSRGVRKQISLTQTVTVRRLFTSVLRSSKDTNEAECANAKKEDDQTSDTDSETDTENDDPFLMTDEERRDLRRRIREVIASSPDVEEEQDPEERRRRMQKLLADYPLVVEEDDPDWPEDADGWGFNFDQFFNKITIKNVKKDDDENYDSDKEIVWQDDNYIRPIRDITTSEWEDTVFKDFNPLVILVHNRYKRPQDNERARTEMEKAIQTFWETGLPSPRCVAVDAVVEQDLVSALKVSIFPEILFTKAGKILHRDKAGQEGGWKLKNKEERHMMGRSRKLELGVGFHLLPPYGPEPRLSL